MKKYYGWNNEESRVMFAVVTGEMIDGTKVYTEYDPINDELVDIDKQYRRTTKHGAQWFFGL